MKFKTTIYIDHDNTSDLIDALSKISSELCQGYTSSAASYTRNTTSNYAGLTGEYPHGGPAPAAPTIPIHKSEGNPSSILYSYNMQEQEE